MEDLITLFSDPHTWISVFTLAMLEIVLGIDNIVVITIATGALPEEKQRTARRIGLIVALVSRLGLLFTLSWIMGLKADLFEIMGQKISGKDLVLLIGGLFLLYSATTEIFKKVEFLEEGSPEHAEHESKRNAKALFGIIMLKIVFMDIVFSLDSVITAVGMVKEVPIMVVAMLIACAIMMIFAGPVGDFVHRHASVKILALSFLVLISVLLIADAFDQHVPKGYVYFAMTYALGIELINLRFRKNRAAHLESIVEPAAVESATQS